MDRIRKLKAERAKLLSDAKELAAKSSEEERPLTDEERAEIKDTEAKIKKMDEDIAALEAIVELERTAPAQQTQVVNQDDDGQQKKAASVTVHDNSEDDPYRGFPESKGGLGAFLHAVVQAGRQLTDTPVINGRKETRLVPLLATAGADEAHGASQQYGGFTVPPGFSGRLLMLEMEDDPTRGVTSIPMSSPTVKIPARVDKNHTSSVAGGITAGWRPETVAFSSSRMSMEAILLSAESLGGVSYVSEELLSDSAISFAAILETGFRDAVADAIITARIEGTGVGEPLGILNSPALVSIDTTGQTTGTITGANIVSMRSQVWRYSRAIWLANHDCYPQIAAANLAGSNSDTFLFNPARGTDVPDTLLGRPIVFTEYCKSISTVGDIMCINWGEYLVGNYQGPQMAESIHVRFENNERAFRYLIRQAGAPWWRTYMTPKNSTNYLSPYVALATRTT